MKPIKPLVLGIFLAVNNTTAWTQVQPPAAPSILDSTRATNKKLKDQRVTPLVNESGFTDSGISAPPTPSIADTSRKIEIPQPVPKSTYVEPSVQIEKISSGSGTSQPVAAPVTAPVVATPSLLDNLPPERMLQPRDNRQKQPVEKTNSPENISVPLREAQALNVPDVNIPLIGFREKYVVGGGASSNSSAQQAIEFSAINAQPSANIVEAFVRAKQNSPTYRAAEAIRDANLTESTIAKLAFLPTGNLALTQSELEDSTRKVARLGVPLFSLAALAKFREADPLEVQAYANFRVQENNLANEVFRVTSNLLRAREQEQLNQANIDTLQQQVRFAEQAYSEGQGTVTDLRDTQVRLNQALASRISAVSQRVSADQEYRNVVGEPPSSSALQMSTGFKDIQIDTYDDYLQRATLGNPAYIAATQALKISELGILRARGGVLPTVGLSAVVSERNGNRSDNLGVSVSIPFGASEYLGLSVAKDKHRAQTETYRGIEQNLRLMIQQLQAQSSSGRIEVAVRTDAISSAELSVQANQKSYLGGVRTQIEVLNSIQTLFDTQLQQINSRLTLAQNVLKLELESGAEPIDALGKVQTILF